MKHYTQHHRTARLTAALCAAGALMAMVACSSADDDAQSVASLQPGQTAAQQPVDFDVYTSRATTRAGWAGDMTNDNLKSSSAANGFGVFAYYTDNLDYTPQYQPNFMYNEHVTNDGSKWSYAVTKYWPNEHGSAAISYDQDRVSFFAYAPFVDFDPATGLLKNSGGTVLDPSDELYQWGIVGTKRNTLVGDPIIQYIASFDQLKSVDLCWGTTGSTNLNWSTNSATQEIAGGYPWLNVRKPDGAQSATGNKVTFNFQHATAKLLVDVKTDVSTDWTAIGATKTKVWVRSIRFTGMAQRGALNLNNPKTLAQNKPRWIDFYGQTELELGESVTVYDGRKNGSEATVGGVSATEMTLGLNPALIEDDKQLDGTAWTTSGDARTGVPATAVNLFCKGNAVADAPIYIIPTGEPVTVEIEYDVETIDPKLPTTLSDGVTFGSSVKNRIKKTLTTGITKFENNKYYVLHLILGMKDVQFDATVADWDNLTAAQDVDLPKNN